MDFQQFASFIPAAIVIACVPGANNLLSFQNGAQWGVRMAIKAVVGRCIAYALMIALVVAGLGQLLEASEWSFLVIKWLGVAYLVWIGVGMLRTKPVAQQDAPMAVTFKNDTNVFSQARKDFLVAMGNPKAILLFSALLPQFVVQGSESSYSIQMAALGLIYTLIEWITASCYAFLGKLAVAGAPSIQRLTFVQRISGAMMLFMAGALALTRRTSN